MPSEGINHDTFSLYHVRTHAVQVLPRASLMNSNDPFIVRTSDIVYVWYGSASSNEYRSNALKLAETLKGPEQPPRRIEEIEESSEPANFWSSFPKIEGETAQYSQQIWDRPVRLFHCSNASGRFQPREIFRLSQDDLVQDDAMLLDMYRMVYVWVGKGANEEEKRAAMELAVEYTRNAPDNRPADTPIYLVYAGREPRLFTTVFHGWDATNTSPSPTLPLVEDILKQYSRAYTLEELITKPKELDPTNLEFYLSDEDFKKYFTMTKDEYKALPVWKRDIQKKKVGLY